MGRFAAWAVVLFMTCSGAGAAEREERFKPPEFRETKHVVPTLQTVEGRAAWWPIVDVFVLAGFLGMAVWLILEKRSRRATFLLTVAGVAYFGFWRRGCICPVGSIQNIAAAAGLAGYVLSWSMAAFFVLPLVFSMFFGRVFCSGVCPLGAMQDLVLVKPVHVPPWIELPLGLLAWAYLGLAVLLAATGGDFIICKYDPFVGFFRFGGPKHMLIIGGVLLVMCMFIGRVYCRFLCPYGVLLRILSVFSLRKVTITPAECLDCRLCEQSCPFGAIRPPTRERAKPTMREKNELLLAMALTPAIVAIFVGLGYLARDWMASLNPTVQLAEQVLADRKMTEAEKLTRSAKPGEPVRKKTDEVRAFYAGGGEVDKLYDDAGKIQGQLKIGSMLLGAWIGIAVCGRVLGVMLRKRESGYTADPGSCVACARCFPACPVEIEKKHQEREEAMAVV